MPTTQTSLPFPKSRILFCVATAWFVFGSSQANSQDYYTPSTNQSQDSVTVYENTGAADISQLPVADSQPQGCDCEADEEAKKKQEEQKKKQAELKKKVRTSHKPLFFNNDFSYLCDDAYCDFALGDNLKKRCLLGKMCYDIGGQLRLRGHSENNMRGLGLTGDDDDFLLYRTRIYGDFQLTPRLRFYAEMIDAESTGEDFAPRPIEVNRADTLNLFFDAKLFSNDRGEFTLRVGTQELLYGAQRVISPLDWANTRRNFQGVTGKWKGKNWDIDGFWTNPMRVDDQRFDSPDRDQEFMGVWSTYKAIKDQTVDLYALRYLNGRGANNFKFNTLGGRWFGSKGQNLWELQGAYQYGSNTDGSDHAAGMATMGLGRKLKNTTWNPTVWLYYDYASGDDDLGAGNGYHHMFPLAHKYLGFMDLFGRRNIEDLNAIFSVQPNKRLKLLAWYHYLYLATQSDTPYSVVMTPFNPGNLPGSPVLGNEIDFIADWKIGKRQNLLLGYSRFFSGAYYSTTPGTPFSGDANFYYAQWTVNF